MGNRKFLSSLFSITDEQAMWRVQTQDDHHAFARLVARWEQPIFRLCARMTGDVHRGEDLKQEVFVRVFAQRRRFNTSGRFSTWLWRIALNLCYDELRKTKRRGECSLDCEENEGTEAVSPEAAPDTCLVAEEGSELVRQALMRLSESSRTVLVLRFCEGLKLREIAEILQIPESTISSRITVALPQITRILEPEFGQKKSKGELSVSPIKSLQSL